MAETELSEVERLQAEIDKELAIKERLEQGLKADKAAQDEHEKKRKAISYKALTGTNARAEKQLEEIENALAKSAQRSASMRQAIETANENIAKLREQRAEAQHREGLARYNEQLDSLITKGADFEGKLVDFLRGKAELETHIEILDRHSFGIFEPDQRPHRNIARALHWALEQRLKIPGQYRDADFKKKHLVPIQDIFARILRHGEPVTDEAASKPDSKENDSGEHGAREKRASK